MRHLPVRRGLLVAVSCLSLLAVAAPAQAQTRVHVTNPSFDLPGVEQNGTDSNYTRIGVGGNLYGWSVTHGDVDVYGRDFAKAPGRSQALALNGSTAGTIIQALQTTPGTTLAISWRDSPDTYSACGTSTDMSYTLSDGNEQELRRPGAPVTSGAWEDRTAYFTADGNVTTIEFSSKNDGGACGALITDVAVHELT